MVRARCAVGARSRLPGDRWNHYRSTAWSAEPYKNTFAYILTACKARAYKNIECVSIWYHKYYMIVQSIHNTIDAVNHKHRTTVYTTLEDPVSHKKVTEVIQYLYDETGKVEPTNTKGRHVDTKI